MPETLQQQIDAALADGFVIVQEGRVLRPAAPGLSFSEQVAGFDAKLLGTFVAPTWRSQFDNRLFNDDERWAHLRRPRETT